VAIFFIFMAWQQVGRMRVHYLGTNALDIAKIVLCGKGAGGLPGIDNPLCKRVGRWPGNCINSGQSAVLTIQPGNWPHRRWA